MLASKDNLKVGNTIIFRCDEYRNGNVCEYDGQVQFVNEESVDVIYLSGYKSQNDTIPFKDVLAKLDKRKPYISLTNAPYSGHFIQFKETL